MHTISSTWPELLGQFFQMFTKRGAMVKRLVYTRIVLWPSVSRKPMTPHDVYVEGKAIGIPKWQGWAKAAKAKLDEMIRGDAA